MAVAVGVGVAVVAGPGPGALLDHRIRLPGIPLAAVGIQLALGLFTPSGGWPPAVGLGLFGASMLLMAVFCAANISTTGMPVVLIGVVLNGVVTAANGGMPVRLPPDASSSAGAELAASVTHLPEEDADRLTALGQIVPIPEPVERRVSFGDLILAVGVIDVIYRMGRPRPGAAARLEGEVAVLPAAASAPSAHQATVGENAGQGGDDAPVPFGI